MSKRSRSDGQLRADVTPLTYTAATTKLRFVLDHVVGIDDLAQADTAPDLVDAILEGAAYERPVGGQRRLPRHVRHRDDCGLMARQHGVAKAMVEKGEGNPEFLKAKLATTRFFLDRIVPEALGRKTGAIADAAGL
jgi:Acetyl-CoA dehydrogenase C-terminal like